MNGHRDGPRSIPMELGAREESFFCGCLYFISFDGLTPRRLSAQQRGSMVQISTSPVSKSHSGLNLGGVFRGESGELPSTNSCQQLPTAPTHQPSVRDGRRVGYEGLQQETQLCLDIGAAGEISNHGRRRFVKTIYWDQTAVQWTGQ